MRTMTNCEKRCPYCGSVNVMLPSTSDYEICYCVGCKRDFHISMKIYSQDIKQMKKEGLKERPRCPRCGYPKGYVDGWICFTPWWECGIHQFATVEERRKAVKKALGMVGKGYD